MPEPRRLLDKAVSEASLQAQIIALASKCGWLVHAERPARTKDGWRTPIMGTPGWPDIILAKAGQPLLALEVKRETGRTTGAQEVWLEALNSLVNVVACVVRPSDWDVVARWLTEGYVNGD